MISVLTPELGRAALFHRHVDVASEAPFLHPAVGRVDVAQDRAQLAQIAARFFRPAEIGLAHDLDQRHAGAVEVDQAVIRLVDILAGVFLQMNPHQPDAARLAIGFRRYLDIAALADR